MLGYGQTPNSVILTNLVLALPRKRLISQIKISVFNFIDLPDFSYWHWILFILCGLFVGLSKSGISGAGMMVVPLMASLFGAKASVSLVLPLLIFADIFAVNYYNRHANWHYVLILMPWTIAGILLGTFLGNSINDLQFKKILAAIIIIGIALLLYADIFGKKISPPNSWWFAAILGIAGGFTTMVGNAAGPVMSIYLLSMRLPKNSYIGTGAWFFLIVNVLKVPLHIFIWETITLKSISTDIILLPIIFIGVFVGIRIVRIIPEKVYRYFIIATTLLAAVALF